VRCTTLGRDGDRNVATTANLIAAVDGFVAAKKTVYGIEKPFQWARGYSQYEVVVKFPLEINGELSSAARLEIVGFPQATDLKFRLCLCFSAAVARLDYTDETHANTRCLAEDGLPASVTGPHYHSWVLNRQFFKGAAIAPKLHNAKPFDMTARFDSILRWFCADTNIEPLPAGHVIALPSRDRLL